MFSSTGGQGGVSVLHALASPRAKLITSLAEVQEVAVAWEGSVLVAVHELERTHAAAERSSGASQLQ